MGEGCLLASPVVVPTRLPTWACSRGPCPFHAPGWVLSSSEAVPSRAGPFSPAGTMTESAGRPGPSGRREAHRGLVSPYCPDGPLQPALCSLALRVGLCSSSPGPESSNLCAMSSCMILFAVA